MDQSESGSRESSSVTSGTIARNLFIYGKIKINILYLSKIFISGTSNNLHSPDMAGFFPPKS